ncbi:AraC family transcriptional regulator [Chitinophaga sp. XS-30]|uniref:helix-turn-helix domain-containing protein n=1 Tax=Chitinophaga sp. XS-30 TaxID=2604421 RepID=UPI0011DD789C|nr:helix-turn-helix domain-containing protein [Chitinophaga sp. XS-30]QEH40482.1 AraC family transcriptional regulator [Chitinophaga sp. XS-30]
MSELVKITTISQFHELNHLPKPAHPLISVVDYGAMYHGNRVSHWLQHFYSIALKKDVMGKFRYGQLEYDFDEGLMSFFAPNQVLRVEMNDQELTKKPSGWILLIHPDFLWNTSLAKTIRKYAFFDYSLNEALFLSEKEEQIVSDILMKIQQEYLSNIDNFSKKIIISQIELLLSYAERFYNRQFITREKKNYEILEQLDGVLSDYFNNEELISKGLPSVQFIADSLNISAKYLSSVLKQITGLSTQQHIHEKLIEKAKEKLSTTSLSVSEIAYELGFEHPQSFSKLFKAKTKCSPLEFRQAFN